MLKNYLSEYAIRTIWCSPFEDEQSIIELKKVSPKNGCIGDIDFLYNEILLPTSLDYYHVYMLGGNHPAQFTFPYEENMWISLNHWSMIGKLVIHLYTNHGILFPLHEAYLLREEDGNFLIAVKRQDNGAFPDLNEHKLYMHVYHNQYWNSITGTKENHEIVSIGGNGRDPEKLRRLKETFFNYSQTRLNILSYFNGKLIKSLAARVIGKEDTAEMVVDGSVRKRYLLNINSLPHFHSDLDKVQKYLVHLEKDTKNENNVMYRDDIDIYLVRIPKQDGASLLQSTITDSYYYHRNQEDSVRMLTHQDYSIPVDYVRGFIRQSGENMNYREWYLMILTRDAGVNRYLINEKHHIRELYRLPDANIIKAMVGTSATVKEWRAEELEKSSYTYLMRAYRPEITAERVLDALGYVGTTRVLSNPVVSVTKNPNGNYFNLPVGSASQSTIYEYDKTGKLLGFYNHVASNFYYPKDNACIFIEAMPGVGNKYGDITVNPENERPLYPYSQYRFYTSVLDDNGLVTTWTDETLNKKKVQFTEDNILLNYTDKLKETSILIGDGHFLAYTQEITANDGVYDFSLVFGDNRIPLPIPLGKLDLWMNGYSLVEGIDYHVDFPRITIVSKKFIDRTKDTQTVTIRAMGFCSPKLERTLPREIGFVSHGFVSVNNHYDLHDENISRIHIGGGVIDPRVLKIDQATGEINVKPIKDATPFAVEDYYIPLRGFKGINLYKEQELDRERFKQMSAYLTKNMKKVVRPPVIDIPEEYKVYSPFFSRVFNALQAGNINISSLNINDRMEIDRLVTPYKHFLRSDPCYKGFDHDFVTVHPTPDDQILTIDYRHYRFLEQINKIYLAESILINHWFKTIRKG